MANPQTQQPDIDPNRQKKPAEQEQPGQKNPQRQGGGGGGGSGGGMEDIEKRGNKNPQRDVEPEQPRRQDITPDDDEPRDAP